MTKAKTEETQILCDSREQLPYEFENSVETALKTGDYSVQGFESEVVIERKTRNDLLSCIGTQRSRFERELQRLSEFELAILMVECNFKDLLNIPSHRDLTQSQVFGSVLSWVSKYGVVLMFAGDRELAAKSTKKILEKFYKYKND